MLEARKLTKRYAAIPVVQNVSFTIHPGEILGYLGPNGSGKSTTVKMITGLIEPSEGELWFRGESVLKNRLWFSKQFGYVPEEPHLYTHLTGREYLQLVGRLRSMEKSALERKIDSLLDLFGLADFRDTQMSFYSKGMRQKVLLSAALLHDPPVLILDEPFSGLDVTAALVFRTLLQALAAEGKMILYSSHVLEVVEKVCSEVLILHRGCVVAHDSVARLRDLRSSASLEDVFSQLVMHEDASAVASQMIAVMRG
ncbi:MAG: ABC transporter ATP-binding protein [Acidobacteria bacterium]|nr:ABC transporter ATP-binding protein [Acidobacteriota bacterium]MBV9145660.1 ABC transporter ATP-binding protein [Acidobacteriota bacterium]MBV9435242.1 ABC transporter ATP-binding protein [Acidobacteriota bacterium]